LEYKSTRFGEVFYPPSEV